MLTKLKETCSRPRSNETQSIRAPASRGDSACTGDRMWRLRLLGKPRSGGHPFPATGLADSSDARRLASRPIDDYGGLAGILPLPEFSGRLDPTTRPLL